MRLKLGRTAVSCALVAAMATMALPVHAFAETDAGDYLGEVAVAYGDDGADQLQAAGYEVVEGDQGGAADVNAGNGTATYIGYKSTDDPSKAITDLAIMNMKGGYSISAWKDELENATDAATAKAYDFAPIIKELHANYKKGSNNIESVISLLNTYTEDDSGMGMGDFLLDEEKCTADTLATVMLQSNPENFLAVEYLLSKAMATNWTDEVPYLTTDAVDGVDDDVTQALVDQVLSLRGKLVAYQKSQVKLDDVEDTIEDVDTESEATEITDVLKYGSIYEALKDIDYGDSGKTLLDLFLTPKKQLTGEMLVPLASLLTEGQIAIMPVVGIDTLVLDSVEVNAEHQREAQKKAQKEVLSEVESVVDEQMSDAGIDSISMYEGVNRDIFTKDNVALTSDVIRQRAVTGDTSMFFNNIGSDMLYGVAAVFAVASAISFLMTIGNEQIALKNAVDLFKYSDYYSDYSYTAFQSYATTCRVACGVLTAITFIAAGIGIALDLYNYHHPKRYTIPDIIVDKVDYTDERGDEASYYVDYEVARLTTDGSAADMNGGSGVWNCLYYTTSKKAGDPVTVDELVAQTSSTNSDTSLSAVHAFGETAALNLNGRDSASYLFFARDAEAFSGSDATGSAFGAGYLFLAAGIALVIGLNAGYIVSRRRKTA